MKLSPQEIKFRQNQIRSMPEVKLLAQHPTLVTIDEVEYKLPHPDIAKDYWTNEYFHLQYAVIGMVGLSKDGSFQFAAANRKIKGRQTHGTYPEAYIDNLQATTRNPFGGYFLGQRYYPIWDDSYKNWLELPDDGTYFAPTKAATQMTSVAAGCHGIFRDYYAENPFKEPMPSKTFLLTDGKRYTFGVEFEVSSGSVPEYRRSKFNMHVVKDGSINKPQGMDGGPEIVTGVLQGDTGIYHIQELCLEWGRRAKLNNSCGLHVHIGGLNKPAFTRMEIIAAYKLGLMLQNEMYSLQPPSRYDNTYCRTLKNIPGITSLRPGVNPEEFRINILHISDMLFEQMSGEGKASRLLNKLKNHPKGQHVGYNHDHPRYCWLNIVPSIFHTRSKEPTEFVGRAPKKPVKIKRPESYTFEFRMHYGTIDFARTYNWILICMAFCNYVENYQNEIFSRSEVTLDEIFRKTMPNVASYLSRYIESQKSLMRNLNNEDALYYNPLYGQVIKQPLKITELIKATR